MELGIGIIIGILLATIANKSYEIQAKTKKILKSTNQKATIVSLTDPLDEIEL